MVPHEWMVKYTPQTEWIERKGMLVWLAEVFTSLGTGLYIVSLFYNNLWGMLAGWIIIGLLKLPVHTAYLGKPWRFWRLLPPFTKAWKTSWITRGTIFTVIFLGIGLIQMYFTYFYSGSGLDITFKVLGGITALPAGIYGGFVLNSCRSIPFWNSALLPILFLVTGIADGLAIIMAIGMAEPQINLHVAENINRILIILNTFAIWIYLWLAIRRSTTGKYTAMLLIRGNLSIPFWIGLIGCGMVLPLAISGYSYFATEATTQLLILATALHTIGAFFFKYCLLKAGVHNPLIKR